MIVYQLTNDSYPTNFFLYYKVCSILKNALNFFPDFLSMELIRNTFYCEILVFDYCSICDCLLFSRPTEFNLSFSFSSPTLETKEQKTFFLFTQLFPVGRNDVFLIFFQYYSTEIGLLIFKDLDEMKYLTISK